TAFKEAYRDLTMCSASTGHQAGDSETAEVSAAWAAVYAVNGDAEGCRASFQKYLSSSKKQKDFLGLRCEQLASIWLHYNNCAEAAYWLRQGQKFRDADDWNGCEQVVAREQLASVCDAMGDDDEAKQLREESKTILTTMDDHSRDRTAFILRMCTE